MKLLAIFDVLRKGSAVADPALWKKGGLAAQGAVAALAIAANPFLKGYGIEVSPEIAAAIGLVVSWVVGLFFTVATSDKIGLLGLDEVPPRPAPADPAARDLHGGP